MIWSNMSAKMCYLLFWCCRVTSHSSVLYLQAFGFLGVFFQIVTLHSQPVLAFWRLFCFVFCINRKKKQRKEHFATSLRYICSMDPVFHNTNLGYKSKATLRNLLWQSFECLKFCPEGCVLHNDKHSCVRSHITSHSKELQIFFDFLYQLVKMGLEKVSARQWLRFLI